MNGTFSRTLIIAAALGLACAAVSAQVATPDVKVGWRLPLLVESVAFSPDSHTLAAGCGDVMSGQSSVRLMDLNANREMKRLSVDGDLRSVVFSPDGKMVVVGGSVDRGTHQLLGPCDPAVWVWDIAGGRLTQRIAWHQDSQSGNKRVQVTAVAFAPSGGMIATASDDQIRLWDPRTGELKRTIEAPRDRYWYCQFESLAFSPDGRLLASGGARYLTAFKGHVGDDIRLWNPDTGELMQVLQQDIRTDTLAFSPDGSLLAAGAGFAADNSVRLWDVQRGKQTQVLHGHSDTVTSVAFSADGGLLASGSDDNTVRLWDTKTGALKQTLTQHSLSVNAVAFSADGKLLATGSADDTVRLWDVGVRAASLPAAAPTQAPPQPPAAALPQAAPGSSPSSWGIKASLHLFELDLAQMALTDRGESTRFSYHGSCFLEITAAQRPPVGQKFTWEISQDGKVLARQDPDSAKAFYGDGCATEIILGAYPLPKEGGNLVCRVYAVGYKKSVAEVPFTWEGVKAPPAAK